MHLNLHRELKALFLTLYPLILPQEEAAPCRAIMLKGLPRAKGGHDDRGWGQRVSNKENSSGGRVNKKRERENSSEAPILLPL